MTVIVAEIYALVAELDQLGDVEAIAAARRLACSLPPILAEFADARTFDLTRHDTRTVVAARLGVTPSQINQAINRHLRRHPELRDQVGRGNRS